MHKTRFENLKRSLATTKLDIITEEELKEIDELDHNLIYPNNDEIIDEITNEEIKPIVKIKPKNSFVNLDKFLKKQINF